MKDNHLMMLVATAGVSVAATVGVMRVLQPSGVPVESRPSPTRPDRAPRTTAILENQEASVAKRAVSAKPVDAAERPEASAKPKEPTPKEPTPEEKIRKEVLTCAATLGRFQANLLQLQKEGSDATMMMKAYMEMMAAMATLGEHQKDIVGDLAVDAYVALFDGSVPEKLRVTDDQKTRFRQAYLDSERLLDASGIPKHLLLPMGMGGFSPELQPYQVTQLQMIQEGLRQQFQGIFSPDQRAYQDSVATEMGSGGKHGVEEGGFRSRDSNQDQELREREAKRRQEERIEIFEDPAVP